jgi:hypothetical protein
MGGDKDEAEEVAAARQSLVTSATPARVEDSSTMPLHPQLPRDTHPALQGVSGVTGAKTAGGTRGQNS